MGSNGILSRWSFLRDNQRLRSTIKTLIDQDPRSVRQICADADLNYIRTTQYLKWGKTGKRAVSGKYQPNTLNEWDLIRLCDHLGLKVKLKLEYEEN